jgi:uncharacterized protein YbaR (Trm112 family)
VYEEANQKDNGDGAALSGYISAPDVGGGFADGSFVSYNGRVYRIAGGAPIYVSNWADVGGSQPTTALSQAQFDALPQYPADGSFVTGASGRVYRIAGGAPIYVSNWADVGGSHSSVQISQSAIDNADGSAPWNHLHQYPADGSFVTGASGRVYRIAGGAPIYVSSWADVGGSHSSVQISQSAIDNADGSAPWNHLHQYPADGTFVTGASGYVYRIAGGAPIYVNNWADVGGSHPSVQISPSAIANADGSVPWNHLHQYPVDGTLLTVLSGGVYKVMSGIASLVAKPGAGNRILISQAAIDNAGGAVPWNHLRAPLPVEKSAPRIRGVLTKGHSLTATAGNWTSSPTSYRYRWVRCTRRGSSCAAIHGVTTADYKLTSADRAHTIRVEVWAHNGTGWSKKPARSRASATVR